MLPKLQKSLRSGEWKVTVAIHGRSKIVAIWPGLKRTVYGVAIDIGSTTIAAHLCNLTSGSVEQSGGIMNPQIRFGEDLMSRVSYVMMHPDEGVEGMTRAVRDGINELIASVTTAAAGIDPDGCARAVRRRQPDHASHLSWRESSGARWCAFRAGNGRSAET